MNTHILGGLLLFLSPHAHRRKFSTHAYTRTYTYTLASKSNASPLHAFVVVLATACFSYVRTVPKLEKMETMCRPRIFLRKKSTPKQSTLCALWNRTIFFARRPELHLCTMWVHTLRFPPPKKILKYQHYWNRMYCVHTNSVHLHVYIHILYIHTHTHSYTYTLTYTIHTHTYTYTQTHIYIYLHTYIYIQ